MSGNVFSKPLNYRPLSLDIDKPQTPPHQKFHHREKPVFQPQNRHSQQCGGEERRRKRRGLRALVAGFSLSMAERDVDGWGTRIRT